MSLTTPGPDPVTVEDLNDLAAAPHLPLGVNLRERDIVGLSAVGHFLCHLAETIYPAIMVALILEFPDLDFVTAGFLVTLGYILLGVGALPVGLWTDAWGPLRVCRAYFLALALASLLVALTPDLWLLFVTLTLLGLAASIYHPVGLAMIALGVRARGKAMGINGIAGNLGIALGPTLGVGLFALGVETGQPGLWRLAYVVVAVLALGALGYFQWVLSRSARTAPDSLSPAAAGPALAAIATSERSRWATLLPLALLYTAMVFGGLNYRVLITSLPLYLSGQPAATSQSDASSSAAAESTDSAAGQASKGALGVFLALLGGGIGQYLGGWLADRYGAWHVYPLLIGMLIPLGLAVGLLDESSGVVFFASMLAICLFAQQPVENSVMAEQAGRSRQGLSYASKFTLTFGIGALGTPIATLLRREFGTFAPSFYFIAASAAVMTALALAALFLSRRAHG